MDNVISNNKGQLMLLTVFLIIIGVVGFTTLLNSMVFSANIQSTDLEASKPAIRDLRTVTESEIQKAVFYANSTVADPTNKTQVEEYFLDFISNLNETIKKMYSGRGSSIEIILNNVTFNQTTTSLVVQGYFVDKKNYTFPSGSLIIPMDEKQTNIMKVYGLIYKTVDDTGTSGLNSTRIPVWTILQNAVNSSVPDFYTEMRTDDDASSGGVGTVQNRSYSGGPFLIDAADIDEAKRQLILTEAANKGIVVHELASPLYYKQCVKMSHPPKVAIYPEGDYYTQSVMEPYYRDGEVPYTELDKNDIINGNLSNYHILTIPHFNMKSQNATVIKNIVGWVANGGFLHAECLGADTMDYAVEYRAGSAKPWYGFIGITGTEYDSLPYNYTRRIDSKYVKLLDNSTNNSYFNTSPPMILAGLADPGAPYNPIAQTSNASGLFGPEIGQTEAFTFLHNVNDINPDTNILGYASWGNGTLTYGDYDGDGIKEAQLMYLEAPYDNGLVVYIAGHNLTKRTGYAERLIFESFFAASMRQDYITTISAKNINVTIRYYDGDIKYEDTFLINI